MRQSTVPRTALFEAILIVVACCGLAPSWVRADDKAPEKVLFVIDASGSMGLPAGPERQKAVDESRRVRSRRDVDSRINVGMRRAIELAQDYDEHGVRFGLMAFGTSSLRCAEPDLLTDFGIGAVHMLAFRRTLDALNPFGDTPLGISLRAAGKVLQTSVGQCADIIVITDGMDTCGEDPIVAIEELRRHVCVRVSVVGLGTDPGVEEQVKKMAAAGGGFFRMEKGGDSGPLKVPGLRPAGTGTGAGPSTEGTTYSGLKKTKAPAPSPSGNPSGTPRGPAVPPAAEAEPILDPASVPKEMNFDQAPPPPPKPPRAAPAPAQPAPGPVSPMNPLI